MVADASIWRLCGSNRKSTEVGGSQWRKELQRLDVSVESMEAFTTSMEAPTASMEGSIRKKNFFYENNFKIRETCENCMNTRRCSVINALRAYEGKSSELKPPGPRSRVGTILLNWVSSAYCPT